MANTPSRFDLFRSNGPSAGTDAPDFTARLLDGDDLTLSNLHGQVVVLHFGSIT
jgi:peroxiredoxin